MTVAALGDRAQSLSAAGTLDLAAGILDSERKASPGGALCMRHPLRSRPQRGWDAGAAIMR
jgi:hypothetical protein